MKKKKPTRDTDAKNAAKKTEAARLASIETKRLRSEEAKKNILYCFEIGMTKITDACSYAGVSQSWYLEHIKAEPEFVEAIERAKNTRKLRALSRILKAGETSWQAQAWYLERVHSEEYALKQRIEGGGKDPSPIIFQMMPAPAAAHKPTTSETPAQPQGTETNANGPDPAH